MKPFLIVISVAWLSGFMAFLGGLFAWLEKTPNTPLKREINHGIIAFGGGILVAAVAFALVPQGLEFLSPVVMGLAFCGGGLVFCSLDAYLDRKGGSTAQFLAMIVDFVPEAIALGSVFGHDRNLGFLLALFMGAQNLPEGFNALREMLDRGDSVKRAMMLLLLVGFLGPLAAGIGYFLLQEHTRLTAFIMAFAGGGILYLIFQDIAPQSKMRRRWVPPFGAVLGFYVGALGNSFL